MVYWLVGPGQLLAEGVMVMVASTGVEPVFVAVNDGIFPTPAGSSPIAGLLFAHAKLVPEVWLDRLTDPTAIPLQIERLGGTGLISGEGFTVIVKASEGPGQLFSVGVMVMVEVIVAVVKLLAVKAGMLPVPFAPSPIDVVEFDQVKFVPDPGLVTGISGLIMPLQIVRLEIVFTVVCGYTVMMKVLRSP